MYYICSGNKGADQLRGYVALFSHMHNAGFLLTRLILWLISGNEFQHKKTFNNVDKITDNFHHFLDIFHASSGFVLQIYKIVIKHCRDIIEIMVLDKATSFHGSFCCTTITVIRYLYTVLISLSPSY